VSLFNWLSARSEPEPSTRQRKRARRTRLNKKIGENLLMVVPTSNEGKLKVQNIKPMLPLQKIQKKEDDEMRGVVEAGGHNAQRGNRDEVQRGSNRPRKRGTGGKCHMSDSSYVK